MSDQIEELIREIAEKHGIAVGRNDPILILQTINNRLLRDSIQAQQAMLDQYKEEMESLAQQWSNDAKAKSERILNAALSATKEAMMVLMRDAAKHTAETINTEVKSALGDLTAAIHQSRRLVLWNLVSAGIALAFAIVTLWIILPGLFHFSG